MLICPICGQGLEKNGKAYACINRHSFDIAREGYVNLLRSSKNGDLIGDSKESARSRRDFLNCDHYRLLKDHLRGLFAQKQGSLLDICCGEGYYTSALGHEGLQVYGFDISREMVRLASKRGNATYFVANMAAIPVADGSFSYATHLFAPFIEEEFLRILKPGGSLYTVLPGRRHLFGLKQLLYDTPYENDEKLPATHSLQLVGAEKLCKEIRIESNEQIDAVFHMTPYYFHTSQKDRKKLEGVTELVTPIEFVIAHYQKPL